MSAFHVLREGACVWMCVCLYVSKLLLISLLINNGNTGAPLWTVSAPYKIPHFYFRTVLFGCRRSVPAVCWHSHMPNAAEWMWRSNPSVLSLWARLVFVNLQVDNNSEGRLLKSEKEETFSPTAKSSLKRQNATAHLKGQHPASIRPKEANQAKQSGTAQTGEVKGATLSSKTDAYNSQPYSQTKLAPRPYTNPQSRATKGFTRPSNASNDHTKVCQIIFRHTAFFIGYILIELG